MVRLILSAPASACGNTFLNRPWKGNAGKGPHDKWVNVTVALDAVSNFSEDQLTALVNELKAGGYTPFVGMFGVGGPYSTSFEHLDGGGVTEVVYFRAADKQMASELKDMVARTLSVPVSEQLIDPKTVAMPDQRYVIENAGLDVQIYLKRWTVVARSVQRHRCRARSQADVEAATDPRRPDGSRISRALIGFVCNNSRHVESGFGFASWRPPPLPHDYIRPQWNSHLWPSPRHHDRLTNSETMSRHGGYWGWHRTENNGSPAEPVGRSERRAPLWAVLGV